MKRILRGVILGAAVCLFPGAAWANTEEEIIECSKSAAFLAPPGSPGHWQYAPDREVEVLHVALDVTPDFKARTVQGQATIQFRPLAKPVQELKLDAVDLNVSAVTGTEKIQAYQITQENLIITFAEPISAEHEASVTITYQAEPTQGMYFRTPEQGYKEGDTHLFTQGEAIEARHWYPCFDSPNEKFTSEITCRVPAGMTVVSNGRQVSEETAGATGLKVVHWSQDKPHANYLISLVAGYFTKLEDKHNDVPLTFYTVPSESKEAANSFRDTKAIMEYFEEEIGVPYPWAKYSQVCVNDFVAGGMENTSATTLTDSTLFTSATENIRTSEHLIAHEMAHQWFGDLVTCKDWSHIWLNEGFATYYEALFNGHKDGRDALLYGLYERGHQITSMSNDVNAIVRRSYDAPREMFGYLSYTKASMVLHMLRCQLGEELYRRCIKTYLERHRYGNVTTEDLRSVIEELSGRSFDQFFDQWLYHAHYPEIEASYSWDERAKLAKLSIRQVQRLSESVLLFDFPLPIRFQGNFGQVERQAHVSEREDDFYFPLASAPQIVRLDPECTLLAKISFPVPTPMLYAQLTNDNDVVGRVLAVEQLGDKRDKESVARLKRTLGQDAFYGVRLEASRALRSIHSDEALEALLASTDQPDARVRHQVAADIGGFYRDSACEYARKTLEHEKNPDILAAAIRELGGYSKPEVPENLERFLKGDSYHNELADAAVSAIRIQDDPAWIAPLLETLSKSEAAFTSRGFAQGLDTLAYLARNEVKKDTVRAFLVGYVNHKKRTIQLASINALGVLGDPQTIPVLTKFASASKESPEQHAAERAITDLRAGRKPVDDFKNLRQEVLDLEKANRDLRKELDGLKKKIDAKELAPAGAPVKKKALAPKST
ncbi:Peptidase M1, membrane alanine aminopeptidase [Verrucomicrobia bacterium]|nr:Peptidase M1, membrane alanine aminopeptidase [Verrucomicrobiota bacterium]